MKNTRPTAESKYVVRTYGKSYYFTAKEEAAKHTRTLSKVARLNMP